MEPITHAERLRYGDQDASGRSRAPSAAQWVALAAIALTALTIDQGTKALVRAQVAVGERIDGFGGFDIHHIRNSGIVRGLFQGSALPLGIATVVIVALMLLWFARRGGAGVLPLGFGFLVGGAVGNLIDRVRLGYVTDFVSSPSGGTFNLADVSIVLGLGILVLGLLAGSERPQRL